MVELQSTQRAVANSTSSMTARGLPGLTLVLYSC